MMFKAERPLGAKPDAYREIGLMARGLIGDERDPIANAANLSALIFDMVPDLNWAGFYFVKGGRLLLGPFQGRPACVHIDIGKGVCGTAAQNRQTIVVADVAKFPGHIACDVASRAEIVVPLVKDGRLIGVLDIDSSVTHRFDADDQTGIEALAAFWLTASDV
ncbi:MAG TPA: GAF domain-containing protein [Rhizomicrobium sp.]|nr:GAF domain-containing protein [Rhizomicrobium sp.]